MRERRSDLAPDLPLLQALSRGTEPHERRPREHGRRPRVTGAIPRPRARRVPRWRTGPAEAARRAEPQVVAQARAGRPAAARDAGPGQARLPGALRRLV